MTRLNDVSTRSEIESAFNAKKSDSLAAKTYTPKSVRVNTDESLVYSYALSIPKIPVIHPYNPTDGDAMPIFPIAIKIPGFADHIPRGIGDLLADNGITGDNLEIAFVAQQNTGATSLLRPNPWLHPDAPMSRPGYGVRTPNILVGTSSVGSTPILFKPKLSIHTHQAGGIVVFSPNNLGIDKLDARENIMMYSVVIDKTATTAKAIVTLHLMCAPDLYPHILSIAAKDDERTYLNIIDEVRSLEAISSNDDFISALNTFRHGAYLGAYQTSGNRHSLQDAYYQATTVFQRRLAIKGFDSSNIDARNQYGMTALTYAVGKNDMASIRACLAFGANPEVENIHGKSALVVAQELRHREIEKVLLQAVDAEKSEVLARFCRRYGFDFYNLEKENTHRVTAVTVAASHNNEEVLRILLERGAKAHKQNSHGNTALKIAQSKGLDGIRDILQEHDIKTIDIFAKRYGFNPDHLDAENRNGVTMLTVAVEKRLPEVIYALVNSGATVGLANSWGKTPISIAERAGLSDIKLFLEEKITEEEDFFSIIDNPLCNSPELR